MLPVPGSLPRRTIYRDIAADFFNAGSSHGTSSKFTTSLRLQVYSLTYFPFSQSANISASFLGSAQRYTNLSLDEVLSGECRVLYVTPEWSTSLTGENILKRIASNRQITLLAIDEAHCVSHWGHDFRKSYRCSLRRKLYIP